MKIGLHSLSWPGSLTHWKYRQAYAYIYIVLEQVPNFLILPFLESQTQMSYD